MSTCQSGHRPGAGSIQQVSWLSGCWRPAASAHQHSRQYTSVQLVQAEHASGPALSGCCAFGSMMLLGASVSSLGIPAACRLLCEGSRSPCLRAPVVFGQQPGRARAGRLCSCSSHPRQPALRQWHVSKAQLRARVCGRQRQPSPIRLRPTLQCSKTQGKHALATLMAAAVEPSPVWMDEAGQAAFLLFPAERESGPQRTPVTNLCMQPHTACPNVGQEVWSQQACVCAMCNAMDWCLPFPHLLRAWLCVSQQ